jgi:hypothetical protein
MPAAFELSGLIDTIVVVSGFTEPLFALVFGSESEASRGKVGISRWGAGRQALRKGGHDGGAWLTLRRAIRVA